VVSRQYPRCERLTRVISEPMSEQSTYVEQTKVHLHKALQTEDPDEKNFHLRNALQLCACDDLSDRPGQSDAD